MLFHNQIKITKQWINGDQWPIFLYHGYSYDSEDPWNGLFRRTLLVSVSSDLTSSLILTVLQGYKHIFMSPSSIEKKPKATQSGNVQIHEMTQVTPTSIVYISTQVFYLVLFIIMCFWYTVSWDLICIVVFTCFLHDQHSDRFREIL